MRRTMFHKAGWFIACFGLVCFGSATTLYAVPVPGGTLYPGSIPKYVTPLVIPPEMPKSPVASPLQTPLADYNIAVRQFKQQILPTTNYVGAPTLLPPTPVFGYGRAEDVLPANFVAPVPVAQGLTFNYPGFTVEAKAYQPTTVRWINGLVNATGGYLPHLLAIDQTLEWANPANRGCTNPALMPQTDCFTNRTGRYSGPVPIVVHLHGSHVNDQSDGFPMAWWLPGANNIPAGYALTGKRFTQFSLTNTVPGSAYYSYENDQPATTLWYHDHVMGITRLNVYAGMAGFWLLRGNPATPLSYDTPLDNRTGLAAVLPGPASSGSNDPNFNAAYRATIREIPLAIQDRSFNKNGTLFYPNTRAFFDGFTGPYIPTKSDIPAMWNPEAFFNTMVVNGSTWPKLDVAPARYRLRLLNGCDSRTLNLALFKVTYPAGKPNVTTRTGELAFFQIGAEQGFLPKVAIVRTGFNTPLPGNGTVPLVQTPAPHPSQALLLMPAERADVVVDFTGLPAGTIVRMINTGPDLPFGGFPVVPADRSSSGQVMEFVVNQPRLPSDALTTPLKNLVLSSEPTIAAPSSVTRQLSLNEMESAQVCVSINPVTGAISTLASFAVPDPNIVATCAALGGVPMAPRMALLGLVAAAPVTGNLSGVPVGFMDPITENPALGATESWEIFNFTVDGHPIHPHLVRFQVLNRQALDPVTNLPVGPLALPTPSETGFKDTVAAYPGQVTRVKATFDKPGLFVWHCHILSHEDNDMMRPYYVGPIPPGM